MAYCAYTDVTRIIKTNMLQADIEALIAQSDAWIDKMLGTQTVGDKLIEKLSSILTAKAIKQLQPTSMAAGEYSEKHDPIPVWNEEIKEIITAYRTAGRAHIGKSAYQHIDEDERYTIEP